MSIADAIREAGFAFVPAATLDACVTLPDWDRFAASWDDLGLDTYMADGGRYRRRRHAAYDVSAAAIRRKPHQPHYQSRDYNPLNGGLARWFEPIAPEIGDHPALRAVLGFCRTLFDGLTPDETRPESWHVEVHQFRIEARPGVAGRPTPEGMHRDGVDWVLVLLVGRRNIAQGVTTIADRGHDHARRPLGSFTLAQPRDAAFVDDSRVYHGVTAVEPVDPASPAYRDVLVVTFRR